MWVRAVVCGPTAENSDQISWESSFDLFDCFSMFINIPIDDWLDNYSSGRGLNVNDIVSAWLWF